MCPPEDVEQPPTIPQRCVWGTVARLKRTRATTPRQRSAPIVQLQLIDVDVGVLRHAAREPEPLLVQRGGHAEQVGRHRESLGLVTVEQRFRRAPQHRAELPAEVVGVLNPGVQTLPAGG